MVEKRKASPQSVKDDTFDGDRLVGSGNGMIPGYARGVTAPRDRAGSEGRRRRPATEAASSRGASSGPKWPEVVVALEPAVGERGGDRRGRRRPGPASSPPHTTRTGQRDLAESLEGAVVAAAPEHLGLVGRPARQVHGAVLAGHEPVAHVGVEGVGPGHVQGRLGRVVGQRVGARSGSWGGGARRRRRAGCRPPSRGRGAGGGAIGSNSHRPAKVPGRACSAISRAAPPIEWPTPRQRPGREVEVVDDRQDVVADRRPRQRRRPGGTTEAPWARKSTAHRSNPGPSAAESGSHTAPWSPVAWQKRVGRPCAAVLVEGQRHAVGGRHVAHRSILVRDGARQCE